MVVVVSFIDSDTDLYKSVISLLYVNFVVDCGYNVSSILLLPRDTCRRCNRQIVWEQRRKVCMHVGVECAVLRTRAPPGTPAPLLPVGGRKATCGSAVGP